MTISTADQIEQGLLSEFSRYISNKADPSGGATTAGQFTSYWRGTGTPAQGAIPTTTPVSVNHLTTSAFKFQQPVAPKTSYLANLTVAATLAGSTVEIHDRLIHMGGLSGNTTGLQTITGLNLTAFTGANNVNNMNARVGDANFGDVQWWVEFYTDIAATSTASIVLRYTDTTTATVTITGFGRRPGRLYALNPLIPLADAGKIISGIDSITLSAASGTAGSFGFTATRYRAAQFVPFITEAYSSGWTETGLPEIYNSSCLFPIVITPGTTSAPFIRIDSQIIHG
jgi:hypothetical protein